METQDQSQLLPPIIPIDTSPFSNPFFLNSSLDQAATHEEHHLHLHQEEQELHDLLSIGGSSTHHVLDRKEHLTDFLSIGGSSDHPILDQKQQHVLEKPKIILSLGGSSNYPPVTVDQTSGKRNQQHETGGSVKWMSSKMRLMRKMMSGDQIAITKQRRNSKYLQEQVQANQEASNNHTSPSGIIRVCSNCNTTKTPLWRSGPQGPKSLCNACGIRQMKARRAMRAAAAAAAAGFSSSSSNVVSGTDCKLQKEEVDRTVPFKKRFKITSSGSAQKKLRFDEVSIKKLAFRQAFPQEERDAAILLMGLSCGLIHS